MSVATAAAVVGAGASIYSSSQSGKGSKTESKELDPRIAPYIYGPNGDGGLMGDANAWYQANKSGMNDQMRQGLNSQWAVLNDPNTLAGYQQMANLGSGLMGAPVTGNPFSDGRASLSAGPSFGAPGGGAANLGMGSPQPAPRPQQVPPGATGAAPQFQSFQRPTTPPAPGGPAQAGPFTAPPPAPGPAPFVPSEFDNLISNWQKDQAQTLADASASFHWVDPGYPSMGGYSPDGRGISFEDYLAEFRKKGAK